MIYGYIRTSRAAVDGLAGMHPETQALADAGADPANIVSFVFALTREPPEVASTIIRSN